MTLKESPSRRVWWDRENRAEDTLGVFILCFPEVEQSPWGPYVGLGGAWGAHVGRLPAASLLSPRGTGRGGAGRGLLPRVRTPGCLQRPRGACLLCVHLGLRGSEQPLPTQCSVPRGGLGMDAPGPGTRGGSCSPGGWAPGGTSCYAAVSVGTEPGRVSANVCPSHRCQPRDWPHAVLRKAWSNE